MKWFGSTNSHIIVDKHCPSHLSNPLIFHPRKKLEPTEMTFFCIRRFSMKVALNWGRGFLYQLHWIILAQLFAGFFLNIGLSQWVRSGGLHYAFFCWRLAWKGPHLEHAVACDDHSIDKSLFVLLSDVWCQSSGESLTDGFIWTVPEPRSLIWWGQGRVVAYLCCPWIWLHIFER